MRSGVSKAAVAVAIAALVIESAVALGGHVEAGWTVMWSGGTLAVTSVEPNGRASSIGVQPTDVIASVDGRPPQESDAARLSASRFDEASVMTAENARATSATGVLHDYVGTLSLGFSQAQFQTWAYILGPLAVGVLLGAIFMFRRWRPEGPLHDLAATIAAATTLPLLAYPLTELRAFPGSIVGASLGAASVLCFGVAATGYLHPSFGRLAGPGIRRAVTIGLATMLAIVVVALPTRATVVVLGVGALAVGVVGAGALRHRESSAAVGSLELGFAGVTIGAAWLSLLLSSDTGFVLAPLAIWLFIATIVAAIAVRPLVSAMLRARLERDVFAEAIEAHRAVVAADIHDDALQDLSVLTRRLNEMGDATNAALAEEIAGRLRDLCYDLRLPVLDDLGAGPAIEWFVQRVCRQHGVTIAFDRHEEGRPPASVELAFYRVAQEALTNAATHGHGPIVVTFESRDSRATLSVADAGLGIPSQAAARAMPRQFGLVNMRQRAEAVGAKLSLESEPNGGTVVTLEWRRP